MTDNEAREFAHDGTAKFRLWWVPQMPMAPFQFEVPTYAAGKMLEQAFGLYDLFQLKHRIKPDYCNMGGVEWLHSAITEGEWQSIDDDEAHDLGIAEPVAS